MKNILVELVGIFLPIVQLLVTTVAPVVVGVISAQLIRKLNIEDANQKLAFEKQLRDALHASAANAVRFALTKIGGGLTPNDVLGNDSLLKELTNIAAEYVVEKNPDTLTKLGVEPKMLRDIIWSKLPNM